MNPLLALVAALAMVAQDILAVLTVQAEARNRAWLAGIGDTAGWLVWLASASISITTVSGDGPWTQKALVVGLVSAANLFGTRLGVGLGHRFIKTNR